MSIVQQNMMQSSKNFDGSLQTFLRSLDAPQALGRYILDEAYQRSFFSNFPWLVYRKVSDTDRVWDLIYIDEKFNIASGGPGMPWPYKQSRQLAGNESILNAAYRRDKMTVGIHRHAVAMENYLQTNLLPEQIVAELKRGLTNWATEIEDTDTACTLFRDYPYYYAETDGLTSTEIDERIASLFGRGTYNDVNIEPTTIFPNGKTDIESLVDTDTLSNTFVEYLQRVCDQEIGLPANGLEDQRPFFGLMVGDPDIQNFIKNSSSTFKTSLDYAFMQQGWKHPIYKQFIADYFGIRFTRYGWLAQNDGRNELADHMSVYKHVKGSPYMPIAKVLAVAFGNETITDLVTWDRGAYSLSSPASRNGLDGSSDTLNIYVTMWATDFPYFDGTGTSAGWVGSWSYNKFALTNTEAALAYAGWLTSGKYVGRLQIGQFASPASGQTFKILYTWPVFVGNLKINADKTKYAQVQAVYKLKVVGLYTWNGSAWSLVNDAGLAAAVTSLKTYLGIDNTNHVQISGQYGGVTYQKRRTVHVFNTVRSIVFGKDLIFDADMLKGQRVEEERRDYNAVTGWGMTMSKGRKLAVTPDGTIRSYAVVIWKRPPVL